MGLVLDASVLISLEKLKLLHVLSEVRLQLVVPREVLHEATSPQLQDLVAGRGLTVVEANLDLIPVEYRPRLGEGESSVIAYCLEHREDWALLDDLVARRVCVELRIRCAGTARFLRYLKDNGLLQGVDLRDAFRRLQEMGFRLDETTIERVLTEAPIRFD